MYWLAEQLNILCMIHCRLPLHSLLVSLAIAMGVPCSCHWHFHVGCAEQFQTIFLITCVSLSYSFFNITLIIRNYFFLLANPLFKTFVLNSHLHSIFHYWKSLIVWIVFFWYEHKQQTASELNCPVNCKPWKRKGQQCVTCTPNKLYTYAKTNYLHSFTSWHKDNTHRHPKNHTSEWPQMLWPNGNGIVKTMHLATKFVSTAKQGFWNGNKSTIVKHRWIVN